MRIECKKCGTANDSTATDKCLLCAEPLPVRSESTGSACPQCGSESGLKFPRNDDFYCEDCGFPEEDFSDDESADLKRLAWLERNKIGVSYNVATQMWETDFESGESFKTARQAIDAAMKPNAQDEPPDEAKRRTMKDYSDEFFIRCDEDLEMVKATALSGSAPATCSVPTNCERLLGEALHKTLIACGVLGVDSTPSGPELLCAAEYFFESWEQNDQHEGRVPETGDKL